MAEWTGNSDDELVRLAATGDSGALETLLQRHTRMAVALACTILADRDQALDAAQTALMQLAQELKNWQGRPFKLCLYIRTRQVALRLLQLDANRAQRESSVAALQATKEAQMPAQEAEHQETLQLLRQELAGLPDETSELLTLYHLECLPVAEIASQMRLSVDACKQRLVRGREELRQRLERRGVCLAGTALLSELLEQAFSTGKAMAATVSHRALAALVQNAVAAAGLVTACAVPATCNLLSSQTAEDAARATNSGAHGLHERIVMMIRKHPKSAGLGVVALTGLILWFVPNGSSTAADQSAGVTAPDADQSAQPRQAPEAQPRSRWQPPRLVPQLFLPHSISANRARIVMLQQDPDTLPASEEEVDAPRERLELLLARDGGQSWERGPKFDGYVTGAAGISPSGKLALLGARRVDGHVGQLDWLPVAEDGTVSKPQKIHTAPRTHGIWECKLFLTDSAAWGFTGCTDADDKLYLLVAVGDGQACPAVIGNFEGRFVGQPSAWAKSSSTAGFVLAQPSARQLMHHFTGDGGKTWKAQALPFRPETISSNCSVEYLIPYGLSRDGDRLVLLVVASGKMPASAEPAAEPGAGEYPERLHQAFTLVSNDLGMTWSDASPASKCWSSARLSSIELGIHAYDGKIASAIFLRHNADQDLRKLKNLTEYQEKYAQEIYLKVCISDDSGLSWNDQHVFDALVRQGNKAEAPGAVLIGGDNKSLFVLLGLKSGGVIRAYTPGQWTVPQQQLPEWLKSEKIPPPTKQDF